MPESTGGDDWAQSFSIRDRARAVTRLERVGEDLAEAGALIANCLRAGGKLLAFGNGGSAAQAQHLAAEFVGRLRHDREALPAIALGADGVMMTALANDFGVTSVFARQIEALGQPGDVALVISTSGSSPNAVAGAAAARARGLLTIGLIGRPASELHGIVDLPIITPGPTASRIQELQLIAGHVMCELVEDALVSGSTVNAWPVEHKLLSLGQLLRARDRWRDAGLVVVWTNGCFDLLHAGHVRMLNSARTLGDILVVGVNDDASVKRLKGSMRPVIALEDRLEVLMALEAVDHAIVLTHDEPTTLLAALEPDIHCKGGDFANEARPVPERGTVERAGGMFQTLDYWQGRSTTGIVDRIRQSATRP
jgi:rfaE bifunctional protein nucleotidyltransferase chain/domain